MSYTPITSTSPTLGRPTTGSVTLQLSDNGTSLTTGDSTGVTYILPPGLPGGFKCRSYQGGAGQITYTAGTGATIIDGQLRSSGPYSNGYFVDIENLGSDTWVITGTTTTGLQSWNIVGNPAVREGDACTFVIQYPDAVNAYPNGVSIQVTGSGFDTAGTDFNLIQAIANYCLIDPNVAWDGVNTLTVKPGARNPIAIPFFVTPDYSATSNRSISITISSPGVSTILNGTASTTILDTSKPLTPSAVFPPVTQATSAIAASGQASITLASVAGLQKLMTVTGSASIPAQSWIRSISGNTITLSTNLTGTIASGTSLTITPAGLWFDFSTSTNMTLSGSNVTAIADKINGYQLTGSSGSYPTYVASSLNGLGGLNFGSSYPAQHLSTTTAAPIMNLLDALGQRSTVIMVAKAASSSGTMNYFTTAAMYARMQSGGAAFNSKTSSANMLGSQAVGRPFIWQQLFDGTTGLVRVNGQRIMTPATLTAPWASGLTCTVDDTSSVNVGCPVVFLQNGGMASTVADTQGNNYGNFKPSAISGNNITFNGNAPRPMAAGTTIWFTNQGTTGTTQTPAVTGTSFYLGTDGSGLSGFLGVIYELIIVPRVLSTQEWRGIHLYLANKWGTSSTGTTSAAATAGSTTITLSSTTGVGTHQMVSGTGIQPGSLIVKVNTTTNVITLDRPVVSPGVSSGATLTFKECSFKAPDLLDVTKYTPTFRDDFCNGIQFANSGVGWQPYYGSPANATNASNYYPSSYSGVGYGSSNNGSAECEWYLDVLNHIAWLKYSPFSSQAPADVPTGVAVITARPTPQAIANLVGYAPPQASAYPYTSGYIKSNGMFYQQYGYFECRMKVDAVKGSWPAFWLTAQDNTWPPEIDVIEAYGLIPCSVFSTIHGNTGFGITNTGNNVSLGGDVQCDITSEYVLIGVDFQPDFLHFYVNREKLETVGYTTPWDFHTPMIVQANLAVNTGEGPDGVTSFNMYMDYIAAWKRAAQAPTIPTGTQAETTALLAAMTVQPNSGRQALINTLIASLKSYTTSFGQTLWNALDFFYMPAAHDVQAARINWKNPSQVATVVGSPTFTVDRGYIGTLGTAYLDTGVNFSTSGYQAASALNQCHIGAVCDQVSGTTAQAVGTANFCILPKAGNSVGARLLNTVGKAVATSSTGGHYVATRNHYHMGTFYQNGTFALGVSTVGNDVNVVDNADILIADGTARVQCAHGGYYLTPDDVGYLYTLIYNFLHAIGAM